MKNTYSISEAQANFPRLVKLSEKRMVPVDRHNKTVAFIISKSQMEEITETLEILANPKAMKRIEEYERGKTQFLSLSILDED
jgi:PHD/YefM family antitoxin component YafN of YafNO toxin-antitoxin module